MRALPTSRITTATRRWRDVRLVDIATLLHNVMVAAANDGVGFEDAEMTVNDLVRRMNKRVLLDPRLIESCLWASNMLEERGLFWDARGRSFDDLLASVLGGSHKFDKRYNIIKED